MGIVSNSGRVDHNLDPASPLSRQSLNKRVWGGKDWGGAREVW